MRYVFGDFELDTQCYELRLAGSLQPLEPQGFKVLTYLVEQRERVVSKSELLERLWPEQYVTDATLTQRLMAVRRALGDDGRRQRYIRTVYGRGYRFVAEVTAYAAVLPPLPTTAVAPQTVPRSADRGPGLFVGREAEMALLQERLTLALQGQRQVVLLSGEAGIGKTTLVDAFVAHVQATAAVWIGRGQCIEQYGTGEAYLPLLEALGRLGRSPGGEELVAVLRQRAPSWLPHLPALLSAADYVTLPQQMPGLTRERMLRELAEALESVTARQPLLLVLEDMHWSDVSTVDWLSYVARRRDPARLLILGTYRPADALRHQPPLSLAVQELHRQRHALDIPLPYWTVAEVTAYLVQRFGVLPFSGAVIQLVHQRTQGHPFFLAALVEAMAAQDTLQQTGLAGGALPASIPESIRYLIEYQLTTLSPEEQVLLEAASVAGESFVTAEVAAALGSAVDAVETHCALLTRKGQFIYALGLATWPDATVATHYGFRHALYQEVLYTRLSPGQRLRFHHTIGMHKERAYGAQAHEIATALAMHFGRSQDAPRGVQYLHVAAQQALQRGAPQEAQQHLTQGLTLLATLPESPERAQQELALQLPLGTAVMALQGPGAPKVEQLYLRAKTLSMHVGTTMQRFAVLWGLWRVYHARAQHQRAREIGEDLLLLVQQQPDSALHLAAHQACGTTCYFLGDFVTARAHLEQGLAWATSHRTTDLAFHMSIAPEVYCRAFMAQTLWVLGYPEQAWRYSHEACALAEALADSQSVAFAQYYAARTQMLRRDLRAAYAHAEAVIALTTAQHFAYYLALGTFLRGWALAAQGQTQEGLAHMRQGLAGTSATGAALVRPFFLPLLADVCSRLGQVEEAQRLLTEAQELITVSGQRFAEAETTRLQGLAWLQQARPEAVQAERCFQRAMTVARQQHARSWELRVAISLGRFWQKQGKWEAARQVLAEVYAGFTEGFDTADLQEARALLESLAPR